MDNENLSFDKIISVLSEKGPLKADVYQNVAQVFVNLKTVVKQVESDLITSFAKIDKRVSIKFIERGNYDLELRISDDILIFSMHTDAYLFPSSHQVYKNSYVQQDTNRAYCGMISVYNFLTDSLKYNRVNDQGALIARIFINRENHFFVDGKKQLGIAFNDFGKDVITDHTLRDIVETAILFCLETDIITPPFDQVKVISVQELMEKNLATVVSTGKRLGFRLQSDDDLIQ